jgi:hypothetical protein
MPVINGKKLKVECMTWGERKKIRAAMLKSMVALESFGKAADEAQTAGDTEAYGEALAGLALSSLGNREAMLLVYFEPQGLTQEDLDAERKPSNIHKAVAEILESSIDPEEEEARKKASGLLRTFQGRQPAGQDEP